MGREHVEVAAQCLHIRLEVGHGLGPVDQGDHALFLGLLDQRRNRVYRSQHVGDVGKGQYPGSLVQQVVEGIQVQLAFRGYLHRDHPGAGALGHHLPGHDVGVVLHMADQDFVAGFQARGQAVGHQVDGLGGAAGPDDFVGAGCVQEVANHFPGTFKGGRGPVAQGVGATVHVGVHFPIVAVHGIQHGDGLLGRGAVVQIHQGLPVDFLCQDREVAADAFHIKRRRGGVGCHRQIGHAAQAS